MSLSHTRIFDPSSYETVRRPLTQAENLPPWCYTDPEFYRAEVDSIFMKEWNFLGRADRIPKAGDYFTVDFAGVPLIIVRDKSGQVKAYANTCRHRGALVASGEGSCRAFQCPYHGWTYGLDGKLLGAPAMAKNETFKKSELSLIPVRLEIWGGFLFVNFDSNAESLADYLGDMPEQLASYDCDNLVTTRRVEYDLRCNWKVYIENAMEEYHVPLVHGGSISKKRVGHGAIPTRGNWDALREKHIGTRALLEEDLAHALPQISTLSGPSAEGTHFVCIYPSTMLGMTLDCVWWLELHPRGPNSTRLVVGSCFPKETVARKDFAKKVKFYYKRWNKSIVEDNDISEVQQSGLESPFARQGPLCHLEPLVHNIANWVLDRVLPAETSHRKVS
jgi:choline monooxygenase